MPLYEYECRPCGTKFELLRPMGSAAQTATCPTGHPGATRAVSLFAAPARQGEGAGFDERPAGGCGGCAGGACACAG